MKIQKEALILGHKMKYQYAMISRDTFCIETI